MSGKTVRMAHLNWHGGTETRLRVESSPHRFTVGETVTVVFADVEVTGFVMSARRVHDTGLAGRPRAEYTIQIGVEAEGDAEVCICIPPGVDADCAAIHAVTADLDGVDLHFGGEG